MVGGMTNPDPEWFTTVLAADVLPDDKKVRALASKVTVTAMATGSVAAKVTGSGDEDYAVTLDLTDPLGSSTCDCPDRFYRATFCKHLLAVSLTAAGRDIGMWKHVVQHQPRKSAPRKVPTAPPPADPSSVKTPVARPGRMGQPVSTGVVGTSRHDLPDAASLPERTSSLRDAVDAWDAVCRDPESSKAAKRRARAEVTDLLQVMLVDGAFTTAASTTRMLAIGEAAELYRRAGRPRHALAAMEQCALRCPTAATYRHLFGLFPTPTHFGAGKRAQLQAWYRNRLENNVDDLSDGEVELKEKFAQATAARR